MAQASAESGTSSPHSSTKISDALRSFSEELWDAQDKLPEGAYTRLCQRAQELANAVKAPPAPHPVGALNSDDPLATILERVRGHIGTVHELQHQVEGYEGQLDAATVELDRLRSSIKHTRHRRNFYAKTAGALRKICHSAGIQQETIMLEYTRVGIKQEILSDIAKKRKCEEQARPVEESDSDPPSDDDSD